MLRLLGLLMGPGAADDEDARLWLGPLTDPRCRNGRFAGRDLAALARVGELWAVPVTQVAAAPLSAWVAGRAERYLRAGVSTSPSVLRGPVTVRGWLATDRVCVPLLPAWHNLASTTVQEVVTELVGFAALYARATAPADNGHHRLVIAFQDFVPASVSVTAAVRRSAQRVELLACLGLDEDLGAGVWRDTLVLTGPEVDTERHEVLLKPAATVPANRGTRTEAIEPSLRGRPALSVPVGRAIALMGLDTAQHLDADLDLDIAIRGGQTYLLACHLV
jgi:hypothetical protein